MSTGTRRICKVSLGIAALALPVCAFQAFIWWWRLGMLWTPDELPGIQLRYRLWVSLLVVALTVTVAVVILLRRSSRKHTTA
jgi:hypothetical protein